MASRGRARRGNAAREQHRAGRTHTPATQGVAVVRDVQVLTTSMGCSRCSECGGKFEASSAEEYAEGIGRDPDYETCPRCLEKSDQEAAKENEFASLEAEVLRLRSENAQLRATTVKRPAPAAIELTKRQKVSAPSSIWVIAKGDWPDHSNAQLVDIKVLGTYSSREKAEAAKQEYLEDGGWEQGYGYHQGESESAIEIFQSTLDAAAE